MTSVLSVALSAGILHSEIDDVRDRQLRYAQAVGRLRLVVPQDQGTGASPVQLSPFLSVHPAPKPNWLQYLYYAARLADQIAQRETIDLITVQDPFVGGLIGAYCKNRHGWPLEIQSHSTFFDNPHWIAERPLIHAVLNSVGKALLKQANGWRVSNEHQRRVYLKLGLPNARVRVIPIPIQFERFGRPLPAADRLAIRNAWGVGPDDFVCLWVGRPVGFKNLPALLQGARIVADRQASARFVLAGDFSGAAGLQRQAESLGLGQAIIWPGQIPHSEVPALMRAADAYVLPSWYEGLARVLVEAAVSELPIVAANSPGVADAVVDGETGLLFDPTSPRELADKLIELMSNRRLARQMGQRGAERAKRQFDPVRLQNEIVAAWRELGTPRVS